MITVTARESALCCPRCRCTEELTVSCRICRTLTHPDCLASGCASMGCCAVESDERRLGQNPLLLRITGADGSIRNPWYHHRIEDDEEEVRIIVGYTASYCDQEAMCRANRLEMEEMFATDSFATTHHDGIHILIRSRPEGEDWSREQLALEMLDGLEESPCINEERWLLLEQEEIDEQIDEDA